MTTCGENQSIEDFTAVIEHLKSQRIAFEEGLSDSEITRIEATYGFRFPPDLRRFVQIALPVSGGFPNWRSESTTILQYQWINRPWDGIAFDIEYNGFWMGKWGPRPATLEDAIAEAKRHFAEVPFLIPVRSHHYLPASPSHESNPVFRVRQTDITMSGSNLISFLMVGPSSDAVAVREIPFWSEVTGQNHVIIPDLSASHVGRQEEYDQLVLAAKGAGFWADVTKLLDGRGVSFDRSTPDRGRGVFWITRKTFGWLLCIRRPQFYLVRDASRVTELCLELLNGVPEEQVKQSRPWFWNFPLADKTRREFGLVAVSNTYSPTDDNRKAWLRSLEQLGWREMSDGQMNAVWDRFSTDFGYPAGSEFRSPVPSITWDISSIFLAKTGVYMESDLSRKTLEALQKCTNPGDELLALDWNHPCYFFDPHVGFVGADSDSWAVPVVPNGDHYLFLDQAFRFGIVGNCVDQTICVFGHQLLDAFAANQPLVFCRQTWSAEERQELGRIWEADGWVRLSVDEKDDLWDQFDQRFSFFKNKGSVDRPGITEPDQSMTWDVSESFTENEMALTQLEGELKAALLDALCVVTSVDERNHALDALRWYENYSFSPHQMKNACTHQWPLPVFPKDNYTIILAPDMRFGAFGNPLERTLCIFGSELLRALMPYLSTLFGCPIRINGRNDVNL